MIERWSVVQQRVVLVRGQDIPSPELKEVDALLATATTHYNNLNAKLAALVPQQQQAPPAKEE